MATRPVTLESSAVYAGSIEEGSYASSVEAVETELAKIAALLRSRALTAAEANAAEFKLFRRAHDLTLAAPEEAGRVLWRHLTPRCIQPLGATRRDRELAGYRCRELLSEWLEGYDDVQTEVLRAGVLRALTRALRRARVPEGALWTASVVGFREPALLDALRNLVANERGRKADFAVRVLAYLGPNVTERRELASTVIARAREGGWTRGRISALSALSLPDAVRVLAPWWVPRQTGDWTALDDVMARAIAASAAADSDDEDLQMRAWALLRQIAERDPASRARFALEGAVATGCDLPAVPADLLTWAASTLEASDGRPTHTWYLLALRARECLKPRQVAGWDTDAVRHAAERALFGPAVAPSGASRGEYQTTEGMRCKEIAWQLIARSGVPAGHLVDAALGHERNAFVQKDVLDAAALVAPVEEIPSSVRQLITQTVAENSTARDGELLAQMAAARYARRFVTWSSFTAVLTTGIHFGGAASQEVADVLTDLARDLIASTPSEAEKVVDALRQYASSPPERSDPVATTTEVPNSGADHVSARNFAAPTSWQWSAAVVALAHIAGPGTAHELIGRAVVDLVRQFAVSHPNSYELSELVGALPLAVVQPSMQKEVLTMSQRMLPNLARRGGWVGWRAIESLIRLGLLTEHADVVHEVLGLRQGHVGYEFAATPTAWRTDGVGTYTPDWLGYCLGLLYARDGRNYERAVATALEQGTWTTAAQITPFLTGQGPSPRIPDALLARIDRLARMQMVDAGAISALGRVAPERLLGLLPSHILGWLAPARTHLARVLGDLAAGASEVAANVSAVAALVSLAEDPATEVREAALDALRHSAPAALAALAAEREVQLGRTPRRAAAEAAAFLPGQGTSPLLERLATDPERAVREAAAFAAGARASRAAADSALGALLDAAMRGERSALLVRYRDQLEATADAGHLRRLVRGPAELLTPQARAWLAHVARLIERKLEQEGRARTSAWTPPAAELSVGDGTLTVSKKEMPVRYTLWRAAPSGPNETLQWGGSLRVSGRVSIDVSSATQRLRLQDGTVGQVLVRAIADDLLLVSGNGPYPMNDR